MNAGASQTSLGRTPSRGAGGGSRASTMSRSQSLIKKNIELQDLKPADVLIERFVAWKAIVKQLTAYFEGIADIENNTAKEMVKLAGLIQVPFRSGNQFLGEGGLQDVYYGIRDKTRTIADQHANLGRTVDSSIVEHLRKLGAEIKAHIRNVQNDTGKLAAGVAKERELSTKLVGELANSVSMYKNTPMSIPARSDPFLANQSVSLQLRRQVLEENLLQKSIIIMQQNSAHFEEGIVRSIQSAWATYSEWLSRSTGISMDIHEGLAQHMASLTPEGEWVAFAARADHLVDPETPLRDPEYIVYPLKDDPSVRALHTGHLERKAGGAFGRTWREGYYVLTPAGFLHEFASSHPEAEKGGRGAQPVFSLFLPNCTLGPASPAGAAMHKFHVEGRRDGTGDGKSRGALSGGGSGGGSKLKAFLVGTGGGTGEGTTASSGSSKAWTFRARSHEDMMEWWNDMRMLCARYLVASESVRRSGPVEAAVRAVGYASEGEEELEDEMYEGSSVELEEEAEGRGYRVVENGNVGGVEGEAPPGYSGHGRYEVGANGYPIDKKAPVPTQPSSYGYGYSPYHHPTHGGEGPDEVHANEGVLPPPVGSGTVHGVRGHELRDEGPVGAPPTSTDTYANGVAAVERRQSRRAMEKAPMRNGGGGGEGEGVDKFRDYASETQERPGGEAGVQDVE